MNMAPKQKREKPAAGSADTDGVVPVAFETASIDDVELAGRQRSSRFSALRDALDKAKVGATFVTDAEGDDDKARAQYRITLYSYLARFGILISAKPTKDGRIFITKRDPATKRKVAPRKKKAG